MATQQLPTMQPGTTDLQALIAALGQGGQSPATESTNAMTLPAFVPEMQAYINQVGAGTGPHSKGSAISDMEGVISNIARNALQSNLPSIGKGMRQAGGYNSTTADLMKNDLLAKTQAEMSSALVQNILNYGQLEQGWANALANMGRAGTSQASSGAKQGPGAKGGGMGGALGGLGLSALSGLASKLMGGGGGGGSDISGITQIMGMDAPSWNAGLWDTNSNLLSGSVPDLGSNMGQSLPGYNYTGAGNGGIMDIMGGASGGNAGFFDSLLGGIGDIGSGIGDFFGDLFSFADGGQVPGKAPADRGKDNVPIMARSGEFVVIPEAVQALGPDFFEKINLAFMPKELQGTAAKKAKPADSKGNQKSFAIGGQVGAGSGTFSTVVPDRMNEVYNPIATMKPAAPAASMQDSLASFLGQGNFAAGTAPGSGTLNLGLPGVQSNAPIYDANDPMSMEALKAGGSMGAGWSRSGASAFLPGDLNYYDLTFGDSYGIGGDEGPSMQAINEREAFQNSTNNQILGLAQRLGYDLSGYDTDTTKTPYSDKIMQQLTGGGTFNEQGTERSKPQLKSMEDLFSAMNTDLKDYARIRTASSGWDGSGDPRSTSELLYRQTSPGRWEPVSDVKEGRKAEHKGWAKEEGAETIAGLSVMLPAVGGFAGLLGQAGSTYAPLINAAGNYALSGNPASLVGALGGMGGAQIGNALGNYGNIGSQIGSNLAKHLFSQSQQKKR